MSQQAMRGQDRSFDAKSPGAEHPPHTVLLWSRGADPDRPLAQMESLINILKPCCGPPRGMAVRAVQQARLPRGASGA